MLKQAAALLAALESYVVRMEDDGAKQKNIEGYKGVLQHLWEWEVVSEDALKAWVHDERAGRHLNVPLPFARSLREGAGEAFLEWLESGED